MNATGEGEIFIPSVKMSSTKEFAVRPRGSQLDEIPTERFEAVQDSNGPWTLSGCQSAFLSLSPGLLSESNRPRLADDVSSFAREILEEEILSRKPQQSSASCHDNGIEDGKGLSIGVLPSTHMDQDVLGDSALFPNIADLIHPSESPNQVDNKTENHARGLPIDEFRAN